VPISVTDPISPALARTKQILFKPFDIGKWFTIGFCAWLCQLGGGGGGGFAGCSFSGRFPGGGGGGGGGASGGPIVPQEFIDWLRDNLPLIVTIGVLAILAFTAVVMVLTWLGSRGVFMFMDCVIHDRAAVRAPWHEFAREGNSFFKFQIVFILVSLAATLLILGVSILIALPDIKAEEFGGHAFSAMLIGGLSFFLASIAVLCVSIPLIHFVAPIMYLRRIGVVAGWRVFFRHLLRGRVGGFALYVLFQFVIGICIGTIAITVLCATCCIAATPYINAVVFLPLSVFYRSYSLYYLEQFGTEWRLFPSENLKCAHCGYNLTGNVSGVCPECGNAVPPDVIAELEG
jgi:hypothetical protein